MASSIDWNDMEGELLYRHKRIFDEGLVFQGMTVTDIGGWGKLAWHLCQAAANVTLIDLMSNDQYFPERVKNGPWKFIQGDICDETLALSLRETQDLVTCFEVLEHIRNQELAVQNIAIILKPRGWFAGSIPIPGYSHSVNDKDISFLSEEQFINLLSRTGFNSIFTEPSGSIRRENIPSVIYFKARKNSTNETPCLFNDTKRTT